MKLLLENWRRFLNEEVVGNLVFGYTEMSPKDFENFKNILDIPILGKRPFRGVFIRAPKIKEVTRPVEILAKLGKTVIAVRQRNIFGTCFHPELSGETRFHEYFLKTARDLLKEG